jgi:hypothetical protein
MRLPQAFQRGVVRTLDMDQGCIRSCKPYCSITRLNAGCFRFFTLIHRSNRPPRMIQINAAAMRTPLLANKRAWHAIWASADFQHRSGGDNNYRSEPRGPRLYRVLHLVNARPASMPKKEQDQQCHCEHGRKHARPNHAKCPSLHFDAPCLYKERWLGAVGSLTNGAGGPK